MEGVNDMNDFPCIDCITLPICRNQYKQSIDHFYFNSVSYGARTTIARGKITRKCSLIGKYLYSPGFFSEIGYKERKLLFHKFMCKDKP